MEKINKLSLPAVILIASVILGGFYYASQVAKQKSIEKQQGIKLQEDRRIEETKAEQAKKEYVVKRKNECYDIYLQERKNGDSVTGFRYNEVRDVCLVRYRSDKPAETREACEAMVKNSLEMGSYLEGITYDYYLECFENSFSQEF